MLACTLALAVGPGAVAAYGDEEPHWGYVRPQRPAVPTLEESRWPLNPIDHFVLARLQESGLSPSEAADPAVLLRRMNLDLVGLPPSVEQLEAFLKDPSPQAYAREVDKALASPRFGERWATPWLDAARYADSNGYQRDEIRSTWPYRDWVIRALNDDMPFDRFTVEQIAGDLLPSPTIDQLVATGFLMATPVNLEDGVNPEEARIDRALDRVNVTSTVWLGSTVECAQCHDHKYDPFSQLDYYRLMAYFNSIVPETSGGDEKNFGLMLAGPSVEVPVYSERLRRELAELNEQLEANDRETKALESPPATTIQRWEESCRAEEPAWKPLEIRSFRSTRAGTHRILGDGTVLVTQPPEPGQEAYILHGTSDLRQITGFRLEALPDESLPGRGPGRGESGARLRVSEIKVWTVASPPVSEGGAGAKKLDDVMLDWGVSWPGQGAADTARALIDGDEKTAWTSGGTPGTPSSVFLQSKTAVENPAGTTLKFQIFHPDAPSSLGRMRISVTAGIVPLPAQSAVCRALRIDAKSRTKTDHAAISDFYRAIHGERLQALSKNRESLVAQIDERRATTLVAADLETPRSTHLLQRGSFLSPGELVSPGTPSALHPLPADLPRNRLGLARWLVLPENPLIARVTVNRWWAEIFGHGLVSSPGDFGTQGSRPSHPELLDWLAVEFVESGWSMKHILKTIVHSATYRQSSRIDPRLQELDPANELYARGPRVRMTAEMSRDNALSISGKLDTTMWGPPVYPPQPPGIWRMETRPGSGSNTYRPSAGGDRFRRSVYTIWRRQGLYPSFAIFDAPDRTTTCVRRVQSNTPLQSLTLLNDPVYVDMAATLAERIQQEPGLTSIRDRIVHSFRRTLARTPTETEIATFAPCVREVAA